MRRAITREWWMIRYLQGQVLTTACDSEAELRATVARLKEAGATIDGCYRLTRQRIPTPDGTGSLFEP